MSFQHPLADLAWKVNALIRSRDGEDRAREWVAAACPVAPNRSPIERDIPGEELRLLLQQLPATPLSPELNDGDGRPRKGGKKKGGKKKGGKPHHGAKWGGTEPPGVIEEPANEPLAIQEKAALVFALREVVCDGEKKIGPDEGVAACGWEVLKARAMMLTLADRDRIESYIRDIETNGNGNAVHNADFTMVNWFGTRYDFALGVQSSAVRALWNEWERTGLGLHQATIREMVDAEKDSFRMDVAFRSHPAFGTMIERLGDGRYALKPPGADQGRSPSPTKPKKKAPRARRNHV